MITWINPNLGFCDKDSIPVTGEYTLIDARNLVDGRNAPILVYLKVKQILQALIEGKKVIIYCHAGLSRSPSLVITVLAFLTLTDWEDMKTKVEKRAKQIHINLDFADSCKEALELLNLENSEGEQI